MTPRPLLAALLLSPLAATQITSIAPFVGSYTEEFETQSCGHCVPGRVFHNRADLCGANGGGLMVTFGWMQYVGYAVYPRNASNSFLGTVTSYGVLTFDTPVQRFGGYFATVGYLAGGVARCYDVNNTLLATLPITAPRGNTWAWNGWDAGLRGPRFKRIELVCNDPYNGGALLCLDDAEMDETLGVFSRRATGCGGLSITPSGDPSRGQLATYTLGTSAGAGFLFGAPVSWPLPMCVPCVLGVDSFLTLGGNPLRLDIPNNASLLDIVFAVQGFALGSGPCLGAVALSDTIDSRIG